MQLLDAALTEKASKLNVLDAEGKEVSFGDLVQLGGGQGTIVVFIRHFFCGSCQEYVTQLASVRPEALRQAQKKFIIIGCGDYQPIQTYAETTQFAGPIYADPKRSLFHLFGLIETLQSTPRNEQKKSYITKSFFSNLSASLWNGPLKHPNFIGKQGNLSQLGGDFIFKADGQCIFASRMKHTEDHVEVPELMRAAGVDYP